MFLNWCAPTPTRYHSLVLTHLNRLYLSLRGHLSDQIREVGFCRQRLGELLGMLQPPAGAAVAKNAPPNPAERVLFPPGCLAMSDALDQSSQEITPEDLVSFDERVQQWIVTNCRALLQVCMGSSTLVKNVAPAILQEAEAFLDGRLRQTSIAEMYLTRQRGEDELADAESIGDDFEQCYEEAVPDLGRLSELNEIAVACLPNDEQGREVRQILAKRFPDLRVLLTEARTR